MIDVASNIGALYTKFIWKYYIAADSRYKRMCRDIFILKI